jgi:hypothetical protein
MFDKNKEDRLRAWADFRKQLEYSDNPIQDTIDLYHMAPLVNLQVDPYNTDLWPDPWELLYDNKYCDFAKILGIASTLQLTDRFSETPMMIHIYTDRDNSEVKYILFLEDKVIGYEQGKVVDKQQIPSNIVFDMSFEYTINR